MWKFFNLFSQSPVLKVNGENRPTTIFGSIIEFFSICIIIGAVSIILNEYFNRLSFSLNSYTDNSAKPDIDLQNFKVGFYLSKSTADKFHNHERLYTISAKIREIYIPKYGENTTQTITGTPIHTIKCNEYKNGYILKDDYDEYAKNV